MTEMEVEMEMEMEHHLGPENTEKWPPHPDSLFRPGSHPCLPGVSVMPQLVCVVKRSSEEIGAMVLEP